MGQAILRPSGSVKQRLHRVDADQLEVVAVLSPGKHVRIVRRSGYQCQYLAVEGSIATTRSFTIEEEFGILL